MNSKLSKSVLAKIKKEELKPLPKYHFILRNILWWTTFILSVLLGGAGLAVTIFAFSHQRFDLMDLIERGSFGALIPLFPFFWILFFGVFVWASFWGIAHTKKAYKIPRFLLISLNIILTLILGGIIYTTRQAEVFENIVGKRMMRMQTVREARVDRWNQGAEQGRLAGEIKEVQDESLVIVSFQGTDWVVDISKTDIHPEVVLEAGVKIGIRGEKTGEGTFKAEKMRPWDPEARPKGPNPGEGLPPQLRGSGNPSEVPPQLRRPGGSLDGNPPQLRGPGGNNPSGLPSEIQRPPSEEE